MATSVTSSSVQPTEQADIDRVRQIEEMRAMFKQDKQDVWEKAWKKNITPWDKNGVQPGLKEIVEEDGPAWGILPVGQGRAVVPGCGRGYDVKYFGDRMAEVWGIDVSESAVKAAEQWLTSQPDAPSNVHFKHDDFFKFTIPEGGFDLGYDYTFFCALDPSMRSQWAKRYSEIIKPGGKLITLIFPIDGDRTTGPPFSVNPDQMKEMLESNSFKRLVYKAPRQSNRPGLEMLAVWERLP